MVKKKFTSLDLYSSEYCEFIEYDFLSNINNQNSNDNYSIKGSGTSIVGSFFSKDSTVIETYSEKVIDYSKNFHSDFMDLYLAKECHFLIASNSGIYSLPLFFRGSVSALSGSRLLYVSISGVCPQFPLHV